MTPTHPMNTDFSNHSVAMNAERIHERAGLNFFRNFWDTYKGHVRGMLAGIVTGGLVGAVIGLGVGLCFPGLLGLAVASFAGIGAVFGADEFGAAGAASASRASGLAEKHARLLDPANKDQPIKALDDVLMSDGRNHHYEFPHGRDKGKIFVWKSGAVGTLVGAGAGALLGQAGMLGFFGINAAATSSAFTSFPLLAAMGPAGLGALAIGLLGLTFGIERSVFKTIFNQTDAAIKGRLRHSNGIDIGREQAQGHDTNYGIDQHRLRRQAEITELEQNYNDKILRSSIGGLFRGLAGGATTGAIVGLAVGVFTLGIACLGGPPGWALAGQLIGLFGGIGALLGTKVFTQAGMEAGAEATARAIDGEFERNRNLRAQGITPARAPKPKHQWFSPRTALVMGLLGAAVGIGISPLFIGTTGLSLLAVSAGATQTVTIGALAGALVGITFSVGNSVWQSLTKATNWVYDKSYFGAKDQAPDTVPQQALTRTAPAPQVTAEEAALLEARLSEGNGQNFSRKISQQLQAPPATLGV